MSSKCWNPKCGGLALFLLGVFSHCSSTETISLNSATEMHHDVFTCKGLTPDGRWVGVTDVFLPGQDSRVVVVTQLTEDDTDQIAQVELVNPMNNVVLTEKRSYPQSQTMGIYYSLTKLMELGGEGKWKANAYVNGEPAGQAVFYVGEKPKEEEGPGTGYFVVGEESNSGDQPSGEEAVLPDEEIFEDNRYDNYIREVTPELPVPAAAGSLPSSSAIENVSP
ncbi:MAG: hypothetical protein ACE15F_14525 [bacterium]